MFKVMIKSPVDGELEEVKVYCHRDPNKLRVVFENKCEYPIDSIYHPDKELRKVYRKDAVANHFVGVGVEVVSI